MIVRLFYTLAFAAFTASAHSYTLDLNTAFEKAQKNNLPLQESRLRWLKNKNDKNIALSHLLPQIKLNYSGGKSRIIYPSSEKNNQEIKRAYQEDISTLSLTQELVNMNQYYTYSQASQKATQDLFIYQQALQNLALTVADQYFRLVLSMENVEFLKAEEKETKKRYRDVEAQVRAGAMTKAQLLEVRAQAERVQGQIIEAEQLVQNNRDILADSIGCAQFTKIKVLQNDPSTLDSTIPSLKHWIDDTQYNNLTLKIANSDVLQAEFLQKATLANYLPTLSLNTNYQRYDYPSQSLKSVGSQEVNTQDVRDNHSYNGSLVVQYPLLTSGNRYYSNQKYQANLKLSKVTQKNIELETLRTVKKLHRGLMAGKNVIDTKRTALSSSEAMLSLSQISFREGAVTVLETLENISNVRRDSQSLEISKYHYILDLIQLLIVAGIITPTDMMEINKDFTKIYPIPSDTDLR